jgi:hypothetical protein
LVFCAFHPYGCKITQKHSRVSLECTRPQRRAALNYGGNKEIRLN